MSAVWTFNSEAIYAALFSLVAPVTANGSGFVTASRVLRHWAEVQSADQPAIFQCQTNPVFRQRAGLPPLVELQAKLWLYAQGDAQLDGVPSQVLNPLFDGVLAALAPSAVTGLQSLGGLVYHAWVEGEVLTDEGVLGNQAAMVLPIRIKVNS